MSQSLTEIAQQLKGSDKKVQLIYAFNGTGKTRLSKAFKHLVSPKNEEEEEASSSREKIIYYNAFTEDLFYWDNDLEFDSTPKLVIQPNAFTTWLLQDEGMENNITHVFQSYSNGKLTPAFNKEYSSVTFSIETGDNQSSANIKISKGEESNFIWSIFFTLIEQIVDTLNVAELDDRDTDQFDNLKYIFIDDPVSSLDDNNLIQLAVNLAQLIKINESSVKFLITTHNPLFYNVLHNELFCDDGRHKKKHVSKYRLTNSAEGLYNLIDQSNDSPFSYHLYLKSELEKAIESGEIKKYHFNFLRNILEKTSTFLGYKRWGDLLPQNEDGLPNPYEARIINISSHSKHSGDEVVYLTEDDKRVLAYLVKEINENFRFNNVDFSK